MTFRLLLSFSVLLSVPFGFSQESQPCREATVFAEPGPGLMAAEPLTVTEVRGQGVLAITPR